MSGEKLVIFKCPECGEQVMRPDDELSDGRVGHWHPTYSRFVSPEEVEVVPAATAERLEAELGGARLEVDALKHALRKAER